MEIFQFDRGERIVQSYGSRGLSATRVAAGTGQVRLTCLTPGVITLNVRIGGWSSRCSH